MYDSVNKFKMLNCVKIIYDFLYNIIKYYYCLQLDSSVEEM